MSGSGSNIDTSAKGFLGEASKCSTTNTSSDRDYKFAFVSSAFIAFF